MHLHRVRIESWRTLREPVELADFAPGLNVVFGPNETGKSTVLDAVCRGLFDKHGTGGADMQARQPWSSALGPAVEIEFSVNDDRFRLTKRFLQEPHSTLRQVKGGTAEKIAEGRAADTRVLELIDGRAAGSGLTKPEHWGLGQVLWAGQGDATRLCVGDDQQSRLREALKLTLDGTQGNAVEAEIRRRYELIFTPQGQYRTGKNIADVPRLEKELADAERATAALEVRRHEADVVEHDLLATADERDTTAAQYAAADADLTAANARLLDLSEAQRTYEALEHDARQTRSAWQAVQAAVHAIRSADDSITAAARAATDAETARQEMLATRAAAQASVARTTAVRDTARRRLTRADDQLTAAERLANFLADRDASAALGRRIAKATDVADRFAAAGRDLAALRAPSAAEMKALRQLDRRRAELRAKLEAASFTLTIEPARPLAAAIEVDGVARPAAAVDGAVDVRAVHAASVEIDGVGRIAVRAGVSDADTLAASLRACDADWRRAVAAFAADDVLALETLAARRAALEAVVEQNRPADDDDAPAALHAEAERLGSRRREWLMEDPTLADRTEPAEVARAAAAARRAERKAAAADAKNAEDELDAARAVLASAEAKAAAADSALAKARAVVGERTETASRLRAADGLTDAARAATAGAALAASDAAELRLKAAARPPVAEVSGEIDTLRHAAGRSRSRLSALDQRLGDLRGRLDQAGAAGLYSQWAVASESVDTLKTLLARAKLEADAIKLLWTTVRRHKHAVFESVLRPVRHLVTTDLARLVGPRYDAVAFDTRLQPSHVTPAGRADTAADVDHLSFGTREQLMLLVRLALARLLSRSAGRQCVVLDDPLVNADPRRQRAALRLLEEAAAETQVIVFTCHPHAYDTAAAKTFDLAALAAAAPHSEADGSAPSPGMAGRGLG